MTDQYYLHFQLINGVNLILVKFNLACLMMI